MNFKNKKSVLIARLRIYSDSNKSNNTKKRQEQIPVAFLVHRKRFELLAFGSVDRRYIQLS